MLVKIEAYNDGEFWCARGIGEDIFTQGKTVDELYANIKEAIGLHFEEEFRRFWSLTWMDVYLIIMRAENAIP
jgi:hypothetical protein